MKDINIRIKSIKVLGETIRTNFHALGNFFFKYDIKTIGDIKR